MSAWFCVGRKVQAGASSAPTSSTHCSSPAKHQYLHIGVKSREDKKGTVTQAAHLHTSPGRCTGSRAQPPRTITVWMDKTTALVTIFMRKPPLSNSGSLLLRWRILLASFKRHFEKLNKFAVSTKVYVHVYVHICVYTHTPCFRLD